MTAKGSIDFEAMILVEIAKADERVLAVEEAGAVQTMEAANGVEAAKRFVEAMQQDSDLSALEVLSAVSHNLSLEEKMQLLRNCWRVAMSDDELHVAEENIIRNIVEELRITHRELSEDKQRLAS